MNVKTEKEISGLDIVKMLLAVALLIGGVVAFYLLDAQPVWVRLLSLLALAGIASLVFMQSARGQRLKRFAQDSYLEVRRVVWPSRQETMQTTLVIIAAVFIMSLFMWGVDSVLFWLMRLVTG